jgi:hypothetical protein
MAIASDMTADVYFLFLRGLIPNALFFGDDGTWVSFSA